MNRRYALTSVSIAAFGDSRERARILPNTKSFRDLYDQVLARPGAAERLAALRKDTLAEIGLYEIRQRSSTGPRPGLRPSRNPDPRRT